MNFQQAIQVCFAKYATFSGRAARSEFWYWQLFLLVAGLVASVIDASLGLGAHGTPFSSVFYLVTIVPDLAVGARRLHDTGRSGWWQLLFLVPLFGWIVLLIWFCSIGSYGYNSFGPDPLPRESNDTRHRVKAEDVPPIRAII